MESNMGFKLLEEEILALTGDKNLYEGEVAGVIRHLGELGFSLYDAEAGGVRGGAYYWLPCQECVKSTPSSPCLHNRRVAIFDDGEVWFPPRFDNLIEAVCACLADIVTQRGESLKRRNRQIRDLRRALRK